jgi:putative inorganic carbon (hco3(-)) transporter
MRDIAFTALILGTLPYILRHPWFGVLTYAWLSLMTPYRFAYGFAYDFPFAAIVAGTTIIGLLATKDEVRYERNSTMVLLTLFPLWTCVSWLFALEQAAGTHRLIEVLKIFFLLHISAMVLRTRRHLELLIWVMVISVGFFGVKGGAFTILSGGGGKVYGPPGDSYLSDNNAISVALILVIPLMYYLRTTVANVWVRRALVISIALSCMAVLGSYSRGALLAVAAMLTFLWFNSKQKAVLALLLIPAVPLALSVMPAQWGARMNTISTYQEDTSAMGRINAWNAAFHLANDRPLVGGGFEWYSAATFAKYAPNPDDVHAAHSIYFQMLGEHGYVGLLLFLSIGITAWLSARRLIAMCRNRKDMEWGENLGRTIQVSLMGYAVGGAFVNIGYWDLIYYEVLIVTIAAQIVTVQLSATESKLPIKVG